MDGNKFGLWKKWFWVGIVVSIVNIITGLVYGIALAMEKEYRKEGYIIIVFAIAWFALSALVIVPVLYSSGLLPHYQLTVVK